MSEAECDIKIAQTTMRGKVKAGLERLSKWFNGIAVAALLLMFAVLVLDIISSKIFNRPITAAVDFASILAVVVASFSVSRTILAGRHIEVEFIVALAPRGVRRVFNFVASLLSLAFFITIVWRMVEYANDLLKTGEGTLTQHIPIAPFAYGIAVACIPAALIYAYQMYRDTKEVR